MWHSSAPGVTDCRVSHWALVHQAPLSLDLAHSASQMNLVRDTVLLHRHGKKKKVTLRNLMAVRSRVCGSHALQDLRARSNTLRWMLISGSMLVLPVTFQLCQTSISCSHFHALDVAADTCWFSKLLFHFNHLFSSTCSSVYCGWTFPWDSTICPSPCCSVKMKMWPAQCLQPPLFSSTALQECMSASSDHCDPHKQAWGIAPND